MKFDLHIHTSRYSPDSQIEPDALLRQARAAGLDGIVITEHDCLWPAPELAELRALAPNLVVLTGIEVSARDGHFLVYGIDDPAACPRGIGVTDLCRAVHQQGGAVVAAHPFRWAQPFDEILRDEQPELDGVELMTNNMDADCRRRAAEVARQHPFAGLGSSDAHRDEMVGVCYTEFDAVIRDNADLVRAIRARRATAHDRLAGP